jgi:hypothetical protein
MADYACVSGAMRLLGRRRGRRRERAVAPGAQIAEIRDELTRMSMT